MPGVKNSALIHVTGLRVDAPNGDPIIQDIDLDLNHGEILAIVGESGSGKTTLARALFGDATGGTHMVFEDFSIGGEALSTPNDFRRARGRLISYVPQNPGTSLNPGLRIGKSVRDMLLQHKRPVSDDLISQTFERVSLPEMLGFQRRFPSQLSGGQQQRVCMAIAIVGEQPVVVLDEPTTGLDVITQAKVIAELGRLREELGISIIYISHDLATVASIADRIAVMYAGRIVEVGTANAVLTDPKHPYSVGLVSSIPDYRNPKRLEAMPGRAAGISERPLGCTFHTRCPLANDKCASEEPSLDTVMPDREVRCWNWTSASSIATTHELLSARKNSDRRAIIEVKNLTAEHRTAKEIVVAAHDISFNIGEGECVALVGGSGSGKTTVARAIAGLHPISSGDVILDGKSIAVLAQKRSLEARRKVQIVFQNPMEALNPLHTIETALARPARLLRGLSDHDARREARDLLELVRLSSTLSSRYPSQISGGERQRVAIARALAAKPEIIICDEITSALDVSVQAAVLELLRELRHEVTLSLLFITHDLGVVASVADRVLVLERGEICEQGFTGDVLGNPVHDYTRQLLAAAPTPPTAEGGLGSRIGVK